jgi:hypothetical protein
MDLALDWDDTFTADPAFFRSLITLARAFGHRPVIVTARWDRRMYSDPSRHWGDEVRNEIGNLDVPIVFAGEKWKREAAREAGFNCRVWIDDRPEAVAPQDHMLAKVREANQHLFRALNEIATDPAFTHPHRELARAALEEEEKVYIGMAKQ